MSSSDSEEEDVYEQDEVLWAKVRGYPWWPAFIDTVKVNPRKEQAEYRVFFFGDNTHANLGPSKLRKFVEFYPENYPKAKTNKRLMIAVQLAEEKLQQNDQDIQVFEELRHSLKPKNKRPGQTSRSKQAISQPSPKVIEEEVPSLTKSRTNVSRRSRKQDMIIEIIEESVSSSDESSEPEKPRGKRLSRQSQKDQKRVKKLRKAPTEKDQIFESQQSEEEQESIEPPRRKGRLRKATVKEEEIVNEDSQMNQDGSVEEDDKDYGQQGRKKKSAASHTGSMPRKRGRPRKHPQPVNIQEEEFRQRQLLHKTKIIQKQVISEKASPLKAAPSKGSLSQAVPSKIDFSEPPKTTLQVISQLLSSREELISYLQGITITPDNAKEILDLDVANVLQKGSTSWRAQNVLNLLKAALLLRYFPDDHKNTKTYLKLSKKKSVSFEPPKQENEMEASESLDDLEIRRKTTIKLQVFLKKYPNGQKRAKELAVKMESQFLTHDSSVGGRYKSMAYEVLSQLKDRKGSLEDMMARLELNGLDN